MALPVFERRAVLDSADRLLRTAAKGRGGSLFVAAEAGLGKTTVLDRVVESAGRRFRVGICRGDVAEAVLPFGLLGQALDQLLGPANTLVAQPPVPGASAASVVYGVLGELQRAVPPPMLLALDDASWSDPDSLLLLRLLCRRIHRLPVAIVATVRPWPPDALRAADELAAQGLTTVEHLQPLSNQSASALVSARAGRDVPGSEVDLAVGLCAGNPFLLETAAGALRSGRRLDAERAQTGAAAWTRALLTSQLSGLTEPATRYLRAASVLGRRFRTQIAADISGFTPRETAEELQRLTVAGLLRDAGAGWAEFSHALVRDAVYELAAPGAASLHEAAFRATLNRNLNPAEAAEHALTAHLAGDAQAIDALTTAGRRALTAGAVETARRYLQASAEFAGDAASEDLLLDLGKALMACGDNSAAIAVHEGLLRRTGLAERTRLAAVRQLSRATFHIGQIERAAAWMDEAVRDSTDRDREFAVTLLVEHAGQLFFTGGPRAALPIAARARELATPGTPGAAAADHVWGFEAHLMGIPEGLAAAESAATASERSLQRNPNEAQWWDARIAYAYLLQGSSRYAPMLPVFDSVLGHDSVKVDPMMIFQTLFIWVEGLCLLGRLDEALAWSDRMVEAAELLPFARRWAAADKALVLLDLGRLRDAQAWCANLVEPSPDGPYIDFVGHLSRGRLALRQGDACTACTHFARLEELADTLGIRDPCLVPWAGDAITAYLSRNDYDHAQRIIEWVERGAESNPAEWACIIAATGRAALSELDGDNQTAQVYYDRALELHTDLGMPLSRAQTLTDYGAFLTRNAEPGRARPLLADALAIAASCGAAWHAAQAQIQWRRAGGRSGTTPAGQLTPQELTVARLAAAGSTNRDIADQLHLSCNTVQTHLRHAFQKLGVQRRAQLADHPRLA